MRKIIDAIRGMWWACKEWLRLPPADGTTWPLPESEDGDAHTVEWKLRYAPNQLTREDQLYLASICSAYGALVDASLSRSRDVLRALRSAGE